MVPEPPLCAGKVKDLNIPAEIREKLNLSDSDTIEIVVRRVEEPMVKEPMTPEEIQRRTKAKIRLTKVRG